MLPINKQIQKLILLILMVFAGTSTLRAQTTQPTWWFGVSGAANFNFFDGTTQRLNNELIVPTAFHKGKGVRPYASLLAEYRPLGVWGVTLNVAYDGRGGEFDGVTAPCNCPANLETNAGYVAIEPALRLSVPATGLYFFIGPAVSFNIARSFTYTQLKQPDTQAQLSSMSKTLLSGQVGLGYDIMLSPATSTTKVSLSPFVSYHPYFGLEPRAIESWNITTVRAGVALKFGKGHKAAVAAVAPPIVVPAREVAFSVRAPLTVPVKREVSETLPLINAVFFDEGSTQIPNRYVVLSSGQAAAFKEDQLQKVPSVNMPGRSAGQLNVYHNILNVLGDRMRADASTTITLIGASARGTDAKTYAESVKNYLVSVFGIDGSRIKIESRNRPFLPSEQPGGTKYLVMLRAEDNRVDIESASPGLLLQVGGGMMKPVQIIATQVDPMDSHVVFNVDGAADLLKSWSITVTDDKGIAQQYGPYYRDQESVPGTAMLGSSPTGDYKVAMTGETKNGVIVSKESSVHLVRQDNALQKGYRYSILFGFDKSRTIESYDQFLTQVVSPLITDGATVIIHGHTDIVGEEAYNQKLSDDRAQHTQKIISKELTKTGKTNVKFETFGFGEDLSHAPFENSLPEERFYNRTVIIDIIPLK